MKRYQLELLGITYNQIESGVYALILQVKDEPTRIPIVVGYPEAQSIECHLQNIVPPRPITHELMTNIFAEFGLDLLEVEIYILPSGVFGANIVITNGGETRTIDSRASDAIALAIRFDAPIYCSAEMVEEAGYNHSQTSTPPGQESREERISYLKRMMQKAAAEEDYEEAARIKTELDQLSE